MRQKSNQLNQKQIKKVNQIFKENILRIANERGLNLRKLSLMIFNKEDHLSKYLNKKDTVFNSSMLLSIMVCLECSLKDLTENIDFITFFNE